MTHESDKCPKCQRTMQRRTTAFQSIYVCTKCEKDDSIQAVKSRLKRKPTPPK